MEVRDIHVHWAYVTGQGRRFVFRSEGIKCLRESLKSKRAALASRRAWGPGARSRALVGVQGVKPTETPGFYSIFRVKYCLNLFYCNNFFTYKKKVTWAPPPHSLTTLLMATLVSLFRKVIIPKIFELKDPSIRNEMGFVYMKLAYG